MWTGSARILVSWCESLGSNDWPAAAAVRAPRATAAKTARLRNLDEGAGSLDEDSDSLDGGAGSLEDDADSLAEGADGRCGPRRDSSLSSSSSTSSSSSYARDEIWPPG